MIPKYIFLFLLLGILMNAAYNVYASPPAPAPRCHISGIIRGALHKEASAADAKGPTDVPAGLPDRYELKVTILDSRFEDGDQTFQTCGQLYRSESVHDMIITSDKVTKVTIPRTGQKIAGIVRTFWWPSFDTYTLSPGSNTVSVADILHRISDFLYTIRVALGR